MNTIFKRFKDYNLVCLTVLGKNMVVVIITDVKN